MSNTTTTARLSNGNPAGDSYAVSLLCPCTYFPGTSVERTVYRNVHGKSAQEVFDNFAADPATQARIFAIWPERF